MGASHFFEPETTATVTEISHARSTQGYNVARVKRTTARVPDWPPSPGRRGEPSQQMLVVAIFITLLWVVFGGLAWWLKH